MTIEEEFFNKLSELIEKIEKIKKYDDLVKYEYSVNKKDRKIGELILREDVLNLLKDNKTYETKQKRQN